MHVKRKHFDLSHESPVIEKSNKDDIENEPKENQFEPNKEIDAMVQSNTGMQNPISKFHDMQDIEKLTNVEMTATDIPETVEKMENQVSNTTEIIEKNEEKKYKCRFCKEAFCEKSAVQKHITIIHFEDIAIVESKIEPFQNVAQEEKAIEGKNMDEIKNDNDSKVDKSYEKFCEKCQKYFYDKKTLKRHTDAVHLKIKKYVMNVQNHLPI